MKVSLKGLPDTLRGVAWPSSACAVRCPVKSGNKRDLHVQLLFEERAHCTDRSRKGEEGAVNDRSVWPESPGLHARGNATHNETPLRKEKQIP